MNKNWRYIPFETYNGPTNMAIDETLLNSVIEGKSSNIIRFYKWAPSTATIGLHQSLSAEIDIDNAKKYGVDVVRRISGGGAVLHDKIGEITYAVICKLEDIPKNTSSKRIYDPSIPERYQIILESLATGLESIGVPIDIGKIHCPALLTKGKKLSGSAQILRKNTLLQHGTILLSVEPDLMYKILKAPVGVSYTKMVQSVRAKVTGIFQETQLLENNILISDNEIIEKLKEGFKKTFDISLSTQELTHFEWETVNHLKRTKYQTNKWQEKYP